MSDEPAHLFVYGTLRPGEVRWHHLARFVTDEGEPDSVAGRLFDTGLGYPAASLSLDVAAESPGTAPHEVISGVTFQLAADTYDEAIVHLDDVEGAVRGLYRRAEVITRRGVRAWVYEYGIDPDDPDIALIRIAGGDWVARTD